VLKILILSLSFPEWVTFNLKLCISEKQFSTKTFSGKLNKRGAISAPTTPLDLVRCCRHTSAECSKILGAARRHADVTARPAVDRNACLSALIDDEYSRSDMQFADLQCT